MKKFVFSVVFFLSTHTVYAQHITNLSDCQQATVQSAVAAAGSGDTIILPAGTCTWTTQQSNTINGSLTIQGQTSCTGSGNPAQNNIVCTDNTTLIDHVPDGGFMWNILTGTASTSFRMTGLSIKQDAGTGTKNTATLQIYGQTQNLRLDHNHFTIVAGTNHLGTIDGWQYGVLDHNIFNLGAANSQGNGFFLGMANWNGTSNYGDGSWADLPFWGTNKFIFFEDNLFVGGAANDGENGGRYVFRYNTFTDTFIQGHETIDARNRGVREVEFYGNKVNCSFAADPTTCGSTTLFFRTGTGLVWGNTVNTVTTFIDLSYDRRATGDNTHYMPVPNGWGNCGADGLATGPTLWDQTQTGNGYRCLDQPGAGKGDLFTFGLFPNNMPFWPHQALEPWYEWLNNLTVEPMFMLFRVGGNDSAEQQNRDWYTDMSVGFNGTSGVGNGPNVPTSTCTVGVGFWVTTTTTLYTCTATNVWTVFYTPFNYPHPLVSQNNIITVSVNSGPCTLSGALTTIVNTDNTWSFPGLGVSASPRPSSCTLKFTQSGVPNPAAPVISNTFTVN